MSLDATLSRVLDAGDSLAKSLPVRVAKAKPDDPQWRAVVRIIDALEPRLRAQFIKAVDAAQGAVNTTELARMINEGRAGDALRAMDQAWATAGAPIIQGPYMDEFMTGFTDAAKVAVKFLPDPIPFAVTDPRPLKALQDHALELVNDMGDKQRAAVRRILTDVEVQGLSGRQAAKQIAQVVGLTEKQSIALQNYRQNLIKNGMPLGKVDKAVARRRKKTIEYRARAIADTEAGIAAAKGQAEAWEQAADKGLIDKNAVEREWVTAGDGVVDDDCLVFAGMRAGLDAPFVATDGTVSNGPPLHVNCRCIALLRFDKEGA